MSEEKQLIITGQENISALAIVLSIGVATLIEMDNNEDLGKLEKQFAKEVTGQLEAMNGIFKDFPGLRDSDTATNIFMKRALVTLQNNIDNPPPPPKSKWQERLEQVQAAQREAQELKSKQS